MASHKYIILLKFVSTMMKLPDPFIPHPFAFAWDTQFNFFACLPLTAHTIHSEPKAFRALPQMSPQQGQKL